jgi:hypothetical protein
LINPHLCLIFTLISPIQTKLLNDSPKENPKKTTMKRRTALRGLSLAIGGLASLPAWATAWNSEKLHFGQYLPASEEEILSEFVETIIPETDTGGAKSLQVDKFILKYHKDIMGNDALKTLQDELKFIDSQSVTAHGKGFAKLDSQQRMSVLKALQNDEKGKQILSKLKGFTVWAYTSSEFFMTTYTDYNMAPGFFSGCVPVKKI